MADAEQSAEELPRPFADGMDPGRRICWVDAQMASTHLVMAFGALIPSGTIRVWATRGNITRRERGQYRYDLEEVVEYARARGLFDT